MIALFDAMALPTLSGAVLAVLFDLTLKGALILALAGLLTTLMKRASAATRHLVWCLALCSVLMLPALTWTLPTWRLSVLSEIPYVRAVTAALDRGSTPAQAGVSGDAASVAVPLAPMTPAVSQTTPESAAAISKEAAPRPAREVVVGTFTAAYETARAVPWTTWLLCIWLSGVAVVLFRFLIGAGGVWWFAYRARPMRDPVWTDLARDVESRVGLRRRVRLLRSLRTAMPMTWGVGRPVVLLPMRADAWSEARRRCVLTHEFAHIKRWDCLTQTLAQLACAVSWFNPLVWRAARRMRHERELACDDFVLRSNVRPSDYATHLLEIARTTRTTLLVPLGAVAMARPSQLEGRVLSILDAARKRDGVSRLATRVAVFFTAVLVLPLAAMGPADPSVKPIFKRVITGEGEGYRWSGQIDRGQTLDIRGVRGIVQATPSDGSEVEVVALPRDERFTGEVLVVVEESGSVVMCLPHPDQPETCVTDAWHEGETDDHAEVDFVARIPEGVHFSGQTRRGNVTVVGLRGDVEALTVEGDIFVQATGRVQAQAVEGDIKLRTASFGQAATIEGNIDARLGRTDWDGELPFHSRGGNVTVELPDQADTDVDLHVEADGHLQTAISLQRHAHEKGERFRGTLGQGGRLLAIHTVDGNITVTHRGGQRLRPLEDIEVRMRKDDPSAPRARPRYLADAGSTAPATYAAAEPSVPEAADEEALDALTDDRDIDADLERLRLQIGQLNRSVTANLVDVAAEVLDEMDLGVEFDRDDFIEMAKVLEGDDTYARQLRRVGLEDFTQGELVMAHFFNVDASYVRSVQKAGYCPSLKELIAMKIAGVDEQYIKEMVSEGYEALPVGDLVELRKSGVDKQIIREMEEEGISTPTVEEMVEYRVSRGPAPR